MVRLRRMQTERGPVSSKLRTSETHDHSISGAPLKTFQLVPPGGAIHQITFTPDGRNLVTANSNGTIYMLWLQEWPVK
jgi:WD40 repeat protein